MPEAAKTTQNDDIVLLGTPPSYRANLARLAAQKKGLRWREHLVDIHSAFDNLQPWYLKICPKGYVPTMLIAPDNESLYESINIIERIDQLPGPNALMDFDDEQR